ncbi:MAG: hypothetical protein Tsb002_34270 [Wenzhouxiangellaceae bacterium]
MPAIKCECGNRLSYGEVPNSIEWLLISDKEFDGFVGKVEAEFIYRRMNSMLKCAKCERLWIFWNGYSSEPTCYVKQDCK